MALKARKEIADFLQMNKFDRARIRVCAGENIETSRFWFLLYILFYEEIFKI